MAVPQLPFNLMKHTSIQELLESTRVVDIIQLNRPLVTIPACSSTEQALSILTFNGITSAPVYDAGLNWFYGFFEFYDVLVHLMKIFVGKTPDRIISDIEWRDFAGDLQMLRFKGISFGNINVLAMMTQTVTQVQTVPITASLSQLVLRLSREHRVIIDSGGAATFSLATQSDIIKFLALNINHLDRKSMQRSLSSLGLGRTKYVHAIESSRLTISAFYTMWLQGVPCLPIVDTDGKLVANLSITDLKALRQENFGSLLDPIGSFISTQVWNPKIPPLSVSLETSLETCLLMFAACRVHHVWIVNDWNEPTSVVSAGDVIRMINIENSAKMEVE